MSNTYENPGNESRRRPDYSVGEKEKVIRNILSTAVICIGIVYGLAVSVNAQEQPVGEPDAADQPEAAVKDDNAVEEKALEAAAVATLCGKKI